MNGNMFKGIGMLGFPRFPFWRRRAFRTVTGSAASVGKYSKIEFVVGLTGTFTNPYDPDQIDLSATFTAPSGATWKINGFYGVDAANNTSWKSGLPRTRWSWSQRPQAIDRNRNGPVGFRNFYLIPHRRTMVGFGSLRTAGIYVWMTERLFTASDDATPIT